MRWVVAEKNATENVVKDRQTDWQTDTQTYGDKTEYPFTYNYKVIPEARLRIMLLPLSLVIKALNKIGHMYVKKKFKYSLAWRKVKRQCMPSSPCSL